MSVITEGSHEKPIEQRTTLDENKNGSFKYLHVTGTAKTKQFSLKVNMNHPSPHHHHTNNSLYPPFATFFSSPISIISKPSKKTSKARNVSTCIFTTSQISLFNRINSQTVRTKYLTSEKDQLCAKNATWSAFDIILVRQPTTSAQNALSQNHHHYHHHHQPSITTAGVPLTYGTEIILKDSQTGICSPNVIIRKVDKSCISLHATGPVSQMQKIALQLASTVDTADQPPLYLSANGHVMNESTTTATTATTTTTDNMKSEENNSNGNGSNHTHSSTWLDYSPSKYLNDINNDESGNEKTEMVNDYLCWTIIGICKFEYTIEEPLLPTSTMMAPTSSTSSFSSTSSLSSQTSSPTLTPISPLLNMNINNNLHSSSLTTASSSPSYQFKQYSHPHSANHHEILPRSLHPSPPPSPPRTIIPFPMVSSVQYQHQNHKLQVIGQHLIQHLPLSTHSQLLEFWLGGAHGPLKCSSQHTPSSSTQGNGNIELNLDLPDTQDFLVSHHDLLSNINSSNGDRHIELPLLMVRKDNVVYHSGKAVVCHVRSNGDTHWSILDATVAKQ
ncbi:beta-trefoil DNA-binding domain-containing protein [Cunninghamella echinulata]|nr:beta-trefoil DNA-binding domain-containing protein [Cunninghamella echinulata]